MISLASETIDKQDVDALVEWLKTYPRLTKGPLTPEYEQKWSQMMGCEYSVFVNSGSSANLLMLYTLLEMGMIKRGDNVVVPAVSWSTDLAPVVQLGFQPILCDCNLNDLSVDLHKLEEMFKLHRPKVLLMVSVLGLVPNMLEVSALCKTYGVVLLEDSCESLGSEYKNEKIGTFGFMSSFSTYFGHHISTIEGGMVCTNNKQAYNILKAIRSHGWDRDLDEDVRQGLRKEYDISDFHSLYRFYYFGFNMRSTDLQAFLGIKQLDKLPSIISARNKNYNLYNEFLKNDFWKPQCNEDSYVSNFAYPVIHPKREDIVAALDAKGVENRPLICGSLGNQPVWKKHYADVKVDLEKATIVDEYGMYLPNHHDLQEEEIKKVCDIISGVIR